MSIPSLRRGLAGLVVLLGLSVPLAPRDAAATSVAKLSTEQLVDAAEYIVRGNVVDVWTEQDDKGRIWTRALVEVVEQYKGPDADTLVVSHAGGVYGSMAMQVHGSARFSLDEEVVLFASTRGKGERIQVVGMAQGKFTVRMDPYSRQHIVQRAVVGPLKTYDHRFLPLPAEAERVSVDAFVDRVQDRLEAGWDGKPIPGVDPARLEQRNARPHTPETVDAPEVK